MVKRIWKKDNEDKKDKINNEDGEKIKREGTPLKSLFDSSQSVRFKVSEFPLNTPFMNGVRDPVAYIFFSPGTRIISRNRIRQSFRNGIGRGSKRGGQGKGW